MGTGNWKLGAHLKCISFVKNVEEAPGRFRSVDLVRYIKTGSSQCAAICVLESRNGNSKTFRFVGLHESTDCRERRIPETRKFGKLAATTAIAAVAGTCSGAALAVASQQMRTMRRAIVERRR